MARAKYPDAEKLFYQLDVERLWHLPDRPLFGVELYAVDEATRRPTPWHGRVVPGWETATGWTVRLSVPYPDGTVHGSFRRTTFNSPGYQGQRWQVKQQRSLATFHFVSGRSELEIERGKARDDDMLLFEQHFFERALAWLNAAISAEPPPPARANPRRRRR